MEAFGEMQTITNLLEFEPVEDSIEEESEQKEEGSALTSSEEE